MQMLPKSFVLTNKIKSFLMIQSLNDLARAIGVQVYMVQT